MTSIFFDKRGKISVIKTSLFFVAVGIVFVVGAMIAYQLEAASRRSPLFIDLPVTAQDWSTQRASSDAHQLVYYKVPGTDVEAIVAHYQQKASESGNDVCKRNPPVGDFPDYRPNSETVPYEWQCLFDRSDITGLQYTVVTVQPGTPNSDAFLNTEGFTVIEYDQYWQR